MVDRIITDTMAAHGAGLANATREAMLLSQDTWPDWHLAYGSAFAFMAQMSSIGKGLQKVGVSTLPELSLRPAVMWQYRRMCQSGMAPRQRPRSAPACIPPRDAPGGSRQLGTPR